MSWLSRGGADRTIDLGSSWARLADREGALVELPCFVAMRATRGGTQAVAVGAEAKEMVGRTPKGLTVVQPVRQGVITDFRAAEVLLEHLLGKAGSSGLLRPRLLLCVPPDLSEVERRAALDCARAAGGGACGLISSLMAAAIGAELPVEQPAANFLAALGGGRTDAGVLSLNGVVARQSGRIGGAAMDEAIAHALRRQRSVMVSPAVAENLKHRAGEAPRDGTVPLSGRDVSTGAPRALEVPKEELRQALTAPQEKVVEILLATLRGTPPELTGDLLDRGVVLCGGASLTVDLAERVREATSLPVLLPDEPARCTIRGAASVMRSSELFHRLVVEA